MRTAVLPTLLVLSAFIMMWEGITRVTGVSSHLLPKPTEVLGEFLRRPTELLSATVITGAEALLGLALAVALASFTALTFACSTRLERLAYPYVIALQAIPIVAIAPLLILWFGNGILGKVVMAALICFFPVLVNLVTGLAQVPQAHTDLFTALNANKIDRLRFMQIPSAAPYFFAAMKIAATLSVIGAIVAELSGADKGLGFIILMSAYQIETARLLAAVLCTSALGIALVQGFNVIGSIVLRKMHLHPENKRASQ